MLRHVNSTSNGEAALPLRCPVILWTIYCIAYHLMGSGTPNGALYKIGTFHSYRLDNRNDVNPMIFRVY